MERNQPMKSFEDMVKDFLNYLKTLNYSQLRIIRYHTCIKHIQSFMKSNGIECYNAETCERFINQLIGTSTYKDLSNWYKDEIRGANALLEYHLTGSISYRTVKKEEVFYGAMGTVISNYLEYRKSRSIAKDTLNSNSLYLRRFQGYLENHGVSEFENITQQNVLEYIVSLSFYRSATRHCILCALRGFLKYLHSISITSLDWSYLVPKDNYKKEAKLPTTYKKEEVEAILNAVDRGSPKGKRDYTILLLAARLGLRASDICQITFEKLLWEQNLIVLNQQKTGKRIELPLLPEIGNAIIDYLKYARPKSDSSYIFLHVNASYERLQEPTIHSIVSQYMRYAGISGIDKKKHGPHALRHSLAGFLLEKKTPLPVISEVLGHQNTETTKTYLRIDLTSLRQCALEVPPLNTPFYAKGGYQNG